MADGKPDPLIYPPDVLREGAVLLRDSLGLEATDHAYAELLAALTERVRYLLDRNFSGLLQVCYRVDLGEESLKQLLAESSPDAMAPALAKALLERQLQKVVTRRHYRTD